ncbi:lipoate--protein ligase [Sedimentibacter sp. B4]|uniref:lipoate--protein ligase n=1 Tax=Sedimentibacter sp. B4 TaxID=304766 RepID=UPI0002DCC92E|nr:lipoate--protein ligase [Sedimentibacter sp. B4]
MAEEYILHKFKVYLSESFDPKFNLSIEEWLMDCSEPDEVILFLWQNENTIVIGRNQNPYKECDVKKLKEDDVCLIRRLSGGGAVYHDLGNLNFTFIASDSNYDVENNLKVIINAIDKFGIKSAFNGRNDLLVNERKFSGNAFISDKGKSCHHGTMLVDVNLDKLSRYLTVSPLKLNSKGIESVLSRVLNLKEICPQMTIESLKTALITSFNEFYNTETKPITLNENEIDVAKYVAKYKSWEWNYSESPDFSLVLENKFDWGIFEINLELSDGKITNCRIFTDSIELEDFKILEKSLVSVQFKRSDILCVIEKYIRSGKIKQGLCSFISDKIHI